MLCVKPYGVFGCGQCMPCRLNRRRLWTARVVLESFCHGDCCMATLTYLDDPWSLVPRDLVLFMKRLRKELGRPVRYFACGEYGDESFRPHFHVALFGVSQLEVEVVYKAWGHGFVHMGELNTRSAQYVCGYVTKKMTSWSDGRLLGRCPEFVRMSLKPAIGSGAIDSISRQLMGRGGSLGVVSAGDVPSEVRIAGKKYPLGRYLRRLLRCAIGWDSAVPKEIVRALSLRKSLETSIEVDELEVRRIWAERRAKARVVFQKSVGKWRV